MENGQSNSIDVLGIKPVADSIKIVTQATVDGASAFLSRICLPAAEEYGLMLRDNVQSWRKENADRILERAEQKLLLNKNHEHLLSHPRIASHIVETGSWIDDTVVQDMWSGLLSSSCTEDGEDDSNLIFINILSDLTKLQTRLLNFACEECDKRLMPNGLITAEGIFGSSKFVQYDELISISLETDIHRLDREIDHLRELGLLTPDSGFDPYKVPLIVNLTPSPLALNLYIRCKGSRQSPIDYFGLALAEDLIAD